MLRNIELATLIMISASTLGGCVDSEPVGGNPSDTSPTESQSGDAEGSEGSESSETSGGTTAGATSTAEPTATSTEPPPATTESSATSGEPTTTTDTTGGAADGPCEDRAEASCDGPFDELVECVWNDAVITYSEPGVCEPIRPPGKCVSVALGGEDGCANNPTCPGVRFADVFFRDNDDGTVDIVPSNACGHTEPQGFSRCSWGAPGSGEEPGELTVGPEACDCAC